MVSPTNPSELDKKEAKALKERHAGGKLSSSTPKKTRQTDVRILKAAVKTNFRNQDEAQEWGIKYKEKMLKKPGNQVLHLLANKKNWPEDMQWTDDQIKTFLDWTLVRHHSLLEVKNDDEYSPLHMAIMNENKAFVEAVLTNDKLINLGSVLSETCQWGNSLHVAIKHNMPGIELMIDKCAQFRQMFTQCEPRNGNTPLHSCMSMRTNEGEANDAEVEEDDSDSDSDSDFSDGDEDDTERRSEQSTDATAQPDLQDARELGWVTTHGSRIGLQMQANAESESPVSPQHREIHFLSHRRRVPTAPAVQEPTNQMMEVVKLLIQKHDLVLSRTNDHHRTPYQERVYHIEEEYKPRLQAERSRSRMEEVLRNAIAQDPIASYIRSYCVTNRRFSRDDTMKALYRSGQERHIEFDLGGLPHASISEDYLSRLSKHLQFESILKYVALPRLAVESNTRRRKNDPTLRRRGLSHLVTVFNWLRTNHVEKIVKVMVIDDTEPSHSDQSIEDALGGFGIEIWDWKRLDLSTDVIWKATTTQVGSDVSVVREVSLYSTGNNSVLMGWASPQGLTNKKKFPHLTKVNLFIREGLEDEERLEKYIKAFKETIRRDSGDRIEVNHILDNKDVSYASEFKSGEGSFQPENSWIDCLSDFAKLLRTAPNAKKRPVKVAIIDDGVDASLLSLDGKISIGKSFCPYATSTDLLSPYYVPSGNHGTCMATLISKICPEVKLYVARLDERQVPGSSHRQITAKSAADAIRWATESNVDIISMSWTIETPVTGNEDMESLKTAVRDAASKEILMFCSTSDQGSSTKDNCYPGDFEGCIKIGGSTDTGEALAWVNAEKVHFLLPGKNVPFTSNEGKVVSYESGSSVATAAASGLAGLLMFSTWVLDKEDDYLKDQKNMREAFKTMSLMSPGNKFPRIQDYFDHRFKQALPRPEDSDSHRGRRAVPSHNLQNMEWDAKCESALSQVLSYVKGVP